MLPSVLFTAAMFDMPQWAVTQIANMQKQFLWRNATATDVSRHKMNPALVYTPRQAGSVGLASVPIACKTQRVKQTMLWLVQRKDEYFEAWKTWMFRAAKETWQQGISPRAPLRRRINEGIRTPGNVLQQLMGEWVRSQGERTADQVLEYQREMETLELKITSWQVKDEWLLELPRPLPKPQLELMEEETRFWPTYGWSNNPYIVDTAGKVPSFRGLNPARFRSSTFGERGRQLTRCGSQSAEQWASASQTEALEFSNLDERAGSGGRRTAQG
jgi:hypothetical protein